MKIKVPEDIYDHLFDEVLHKRMTENREEGFFHNAEMTLRTIEFLEKNFEKEKDDSKRTY